MTLTIEPDEHRVAAWKAKAAAQGLTLEAWLKKLADEEAGTETEPAQQSSLQSAVNLFVQNMRNVPSDAMAALPEDGASQHDHYIYGWPKREA